MADRQKAYCPSRLFRATLHDGGGFCDACGSKGDANIGTLSAPHALFSTGGVPANGFEGSVIQNFGNAKAIDLGNVGINDVSALTDLVNQIKHNLGYFFRLCFANDGAHLGCFFGEPLSELLGGVITIISRQRCLGCFAGFNGCGGFSTAKRLGYGFQELLEAYCAH